MALGVEIAAAVAAIAAAAAAAINWWQARLSKKQIQLQAIIELDREWNSKDMLAKRRSVWKDDKSVDIDLVWDTLGWYLLRYYFYSTTAIEFLRDTWTKTTDNTLYGDLEELYGKLLNMEIKERNKKKKKTEQEELKDKRTKFVESEKKRPITL